MNFYGKTLDAILKKRRTGFFHRCLKKEKAF
jgi:hypothetical protein